MYRVTQECSAGERYNNKKTELTSLICKVSFQVRRTESDLYMLYKQISGYVSPRDKYGLSDFTKGLAAYMKPAGNEKLMADRQLGLQK